MGKSCGGFVRPGSQANVLDKFKLETSKRDKVGDFVGNPPELGLLAG